MALKASSHVAGAGRRAAGFDPSLSVDSLLIKDLGRVILGGGFVSLPGVSVQRMKAKSTPIPAPPPEQ